MALLAKLVLRQSQSLVMTPQLQQAIKLLQLSNLDLEAYVAAEVERNPLLEHLEAEAEGPDPGASDRGEAAAGSPDVVGWIEPVADGVAERVDADPGDLFPGEASPSRQSDGPSLGAWSGVGISTDAPADLDAMAAADRSLADHLLEQLSLAGLDPKRRLIGASLIALVDDAGYLREPLDEIAARLGVPLDCVEETLDVLKGFDPPGLFARDLAECLAMQLADRQRLDPAMQVLLANLDLVARRDLARLRERCGVDGEDLGEMLAELRSLNPKPGMAFGGTPIRPVMPDVIVRAGPDGGWLVELDPDTLPRVLVDRPYYAKVARGTRDPRDRAYLAECLQNANWLVKSLDQRARTILKVAVEIVRQQDAFLAQGVQHLRPLNLKTVADAIGMHESTVSRVTANKAMATPRGIFSMKYFFTTALAAADGGESHSAEAVRHRIRQLIDGESAQDVLSDDEIVRRLRSEGIEIARRTVGKYREAMRIPSSVQRRTEKALLHA